MPFTFYKALSQQNITTVHRDQQNRHFYDFPRPREVDWVARGGTASPPVRADSLPSPGQSHPTLWEGAASLPLKILQDGIISAPFLWSFLLCLLTHIPSTAALPPPQRAPHEMVPVTSFPQAPPPHNRWPQGQRGLTPSPSPSLSWPILCISAWQQPAELRPAASRAASSSSCLGLPLLFPCCHLLSEFSLHHQSFSPAPTPLPPCPQDSLQAHLSPSCEPLQWRVSSLDIWDRLVLDSVDQVEEDRSRYLYMLFSIHPLPRNQLLAHTLPRLKATTSASLSSSFPCSNLSPHAGGILDQLPGTAGSESEPCSLGPWDAERGAGVGRRRGFVLQAAELSRGEVQVRRPCFPLLAKHPCERGRHPLADTSSDCSIRAGSNPASLTR